MKNFRLINYYIILLAVSFLLLPLQVCATDRDAYISDTELHEILKNTDMRYVYLGKEFSNIYEIISQINILEDHADSIAFKLKKHIDEGFSIGLYDPVVEVLNYATKVLEENSSKLSPQKIQKINHALEVLINQVTNQTLTIKSSRIEDFLELDAALDDDSMSTRCGCTLGVVECGPVKKNKVIKIRADLDVCENARFRKNVEIDGKLKVNKAVFKGDVKFEEDVCFEDDVCFNDNVVFEDKVTFKDNVTFEEDATINGSLTIVDLASPGCIQNLCVETLTVIDIIIPIGTCIDNLCINDLTVTDLVVLTCMDNLCVNNLSVVNETVSGNLTVTDQIADNITVTNLTANDAVITTLSVVDCMNNLCVLNLSAVDASIDTLSVNNEFANNITVTNLTVTGGVITDLTVINCLADLCVLNLSVVDETVSGNLTVNNEIATNITVTNLTVDDAVITTLSVVDCMNNLCVLSLSAVDSSVGTLSVNNEFANNITVTNLTVADAVITNLSVINCLADLCVLNLSVVDETVSGNLTVNNEIVTNLNATNLSATDAIITNGTILNLSSTDAVIANLTVTNCMASLCVIDLSAVDSSVSGTLSATDVVAGTFDIGCNINVGCNISMNDSISPAVGNIIKANNRFMHNFGTDNTFLGVNAGNFTMTGIENVGIGTNALISNTLGSDNTAVGSFALVSNTTGASNVAFGVLALANNTLGEENSAFGNFNLLANTIGNENSAVGFNSGISLTTGDDNIFIGNRSGITTTTGSDNTIIGYNAGLSLVTGNDNIYISSPGDVSENGTIRIGTPATHVNTYMQGVYLSAIVDEALVCLLIPSLLNPFPCQALGVEASGKLGMGVILSSERFKHDIKDMGNQTEGLHKLRTVSFLYNSDETKTLQYGLIAEEVEQIFPALVVYDEEGKPYTVRYHMLPMLLLNEIQKLNTTVEDRAVTINDLKLNNKKVDEMIQKANAEITALCN